MQPQKPRVALHGGAQARGGGGNVRQWLGDDGGQHAGDAAFRQASHEMVPAFRRGGGAIYPQGAVIMQVDQPRPQHAVGKMQIRAGLSRQNRDDAAARDFDGGGAGEMLTIEQALGKNPHRYNLSRAAKQGKRRPAEVGNEPFLCGAGRLKARGGGPKPAYLQALP